MPAKRLIFGLLFASTFGMLSSCREHEMTKAEVIAWFGNFGGHANWPFYQGSDSRHHYFAVRAFDEWFFVRLSRSELTLSDERPYASTSSMPFSYYQVNPYEEFEKIADINRPNQALQPTPMLVTPRADARVAPSTGVADL